LDALRLLVLDDSYDEQAAEVGARTASANAREFGRVFKIDVPAIQPGIQPTLDTFRKANADLITSLQADALDEVAELVDDAWTRGTRVEDLRKQIQDRFDVTTSRADLIARDQILKLNGQITRTRQISAGITEYIWTTSNDERVREDHDALDGTRQRWDAPPVTDTRTRETNHPGEDYQCRCVAAPVLSFLEDGEE